MFKPTYLYVKTHNKTGLKYFGKTTTPDPNNMKDLVLCGQDI